MLAEHWDVIGPLVGTAAGAAVGVFRAALKGKLVAAYRHKAEASEAREVALLAEQTTLRAALDELRDEIERLEAECLTCREGRP